MKRINAYAIAAGCFLYLNREASGQVIYTDIDPNVWWQWDHNDFEFAIDVDQDGLMDFRFFTCSSSTEYYSCSGFAAAFFISAYRSNLVGNTLLPLPTPSDMNCVCVGICESFYNQTMGVRPALADDTISIEDNWGTAQLIFAENSCDFPDPNYGLFTRTDEYDYFIPLQLNDYGTHLGWVRLNHKESIAEKIIFDMAYETQPEKPVIAGDTTDLVDVLETSDNYISSMYVYGNELFLYLKENVKCELSLFDTQGNKIFTDFIHDVYYSTELNLPCGVYVVKLEGDNILSSKQLQVISKIIK